VTKDLKMKKAIILPVLASAILSGCGGGSDSGSGSGSGSTPAPKTKHVLQFVQLVERDASIDDSCTLFDVNGQTVGKETYARLASKVTVKTYDADGNFDEDLSDSVSDVGILNFAKDEIKDGGYISVIDSPSDNEYYYKVLSIQKALLSDVIIEVNQNQGIQAACYTADKMATLNTGFASVYTTDIAANSYSFNSSQSDLDAGVSASKEISAFSNEDVLVRAYNNNALVDYAFVSTLTAAANGDLKPLTGVELAPYSWDISLPANELTALSVRLIQGNYSYPWVDAKFIAATGNTTDFTYVDDTDANWSYSAEGTTTLNWHFKHNNILSTTLDVQLPTELILSDNDPEINTVASNFAFQAQGIDSTLTRLQRSEYDILYNSSNTLNHVIYSEVASGENVIIPNLGLANLEDPTSATNLTIAVLSADTLTADLQTFFMYEHAASDLVSVVLSPADTVQNNKTKNTGSYTLLNR
jgi:hypothetical protein